MPNTPWTSPTSFSDQRIRAAAVYCSDGRFGEHFDDLCQNHLALPRYDRLAIPGGAACLAGHPETQHEEHAAHDELRFLAEVHAIERVVLIAHQGCAFYTHRLKVDTDDLRARQLDDLARAAKHVQQLDPALRVDAYFAAINAGKINFEPIDL